MKRAMALSIAFGCSALPVWAEEPIWRAATTPLSISPQNRSAVQDSRKSADGMPAATCPAMYSLTPAATPFQTPAVTPAAAKPSLQLPSSVATPIVVPHRLRIVRGTSPDDEADIWRGSSSVPTHPTKDAPTAAAKPATSEPTTPQGPQTPATTTPSASTPAATVPEFSVAEPRSLPGRATITSAPTASGMPSTLRAAGMSGMPSGGVVPVQHSSPSPSVPSVPGVPGASVPSTPSVPSMPGVSGVPGVPIVEPVPVDPGRLSSFVPGRAVAPQRAFVGAQEPMISPMLPMPLPRSGPEPSMRDPQPKAPTYEKLPPPKSLMSDHLPGWSNASAWEHGSESVGEVVLPGDSFHAPRASATTGPHRPRLMRGSPEIRLVREPLFADVLFPGFQPSWYLRAEYLLWWMTEARTPVLLTAGPPRLLPNGGVIGGFLNDPATQVLFGPGDTDIGLRDGGRFTLGMWFTEARTFGVEGNFWFLGSRGYQFATNNFLNPGLVLTRPVFALNPDPSGGLLGLPGPFGELVAVPGLFNGAANIVGNSYIYGTEANLLFSKCACPSPCDVPVPLRTEWFVGYRHVGLDESIEITEDITFLGAASSFPSGAAVDIPGTRTLVVDRFQVQNRFNGGQLGVRRIRQFDRWMSEVRASVAFGVTHQILDIQGIAVRNIPGRPTTFTPGGLLALPSNIGRSSRNQFSIVPELTLNVGYQLSDNLRLFAGYNLLYWTNVLRATEQIDTTIDVTLAPLVPPGSFTPAGQNRPARLWQNADVFLHGINLGAELRW